MSQSERAGGRAGLGTELAVVGAVVALLTVCAIKVFPQMDDAYLLLLIKEQGATAIRSAHADRPAVGALWQGLAVASGASFWRAGFVAHFVLWLALGLLAARLWRRLFPGWERFAVLAAVLSVAPIVVRTQLSTVTISLLGVLSVVPVWLAVLCAWRFAETGRPALLACAVVLTGAGALLSEYGAVAAVSGAVLLAVAEKGPRARWSAAGLAAVSVVGYVAYVRMGSFAARPLVDPTRQLGSLSVLLRAPFNLATRFWDAVAGDLFLSASALQLEWQSKWSLAGVGAGVVLAAVLWRTSRSTPGESDAEQHVRRGRGILALTASLLAGLLPVALMRPVFRSDFASRFEIPILPVAASLTVAVLLAIVRARLQPLVAAFLGLVIGAATVRLCADAVRQRRAMASVASVLEPLVRSGPGVTLAVLSGNDLCYTSQVCTGSITRDWSADLGRKLWVETAADARSSMGRRGACGSPVLTGLAERRFERGAPQAPSWVDLVDQAPRVDSYCLASGGPQGAQ